MQKCKKMYLANVRNMPSAKVMYLGAMWRWGRVGDILADVLSYRSCLTSREREGEGGLMPHRDTRLNSNQTKPTKQTTPIWQNIYSKTKPNSTLPNQSYRTCLTREREGNHATQRYLTQTVSTISNQSYCREAGGFIPI